MRYTIEEKEPGMDPERMRRIKETVEYYAEKYKGQLPWVTVERQLYDNQMNFEERDR